MLNNLSRDASTAYKNLYEAVVNNKKKQGCALPNAALARRFVNHLFTTLFICKTEADNNIFEVQAQLNKAEQQLQKVLFPLFKNQAVSNHHTKVFFEALPAIYAILMEDAHAIYNSDPAAKTIEQVFVSYPGFFGIAVHRFAHQLLQQEIPLLPRILSEFAHSKTGIDIHPAAIIGAGFAIDHGTGIVIGETTVIGNQVKIYQGVTLGALSVEKDKAAQKRHPTIEDNVVIYAGATILGGQTIIGNNSIIGGNVWVTKSVEPYSVVYYKTEASVVDKNHTEEPYNFFI